MGKRDKLLIGKRLKRIREEQKKTQKNVADYLGISVQAYSYYEKDEREVSSSTLKKLSEYFQLSADSLLSDESEEMRLSRITGLSSEAIRQLMLMKNTREELSQVVSSLIETKEFEYSIVQLTLAKLVELQNVDSNSDLYELQERLNQKLIFDGKADLMNSYQSSIREIRDMYLFTAQDCVRQAFENVVKEVWNNGTR